MTIFPLSVVKAHMKKHYQNILDSLPQRVADDAIFRPPLEGTTFGVRFSTLELSQLYLDKARYYSYVNAVTGDAVQLDATVRKSDERRARGRALHPAYLALTSFGYDRDTIVLKHEDVGGIHTARISVAEKEGSAFRLGVAQYTMRGDGTAAIRGILVDDAAKASKPDVVKKLCECLGLVA